MDSRLQDKILEGESKVLEFKEVLSQGDKIAKTVTASSNTSGGQLIIGVGDDRTIKGIDPDVDIFEDVLAGRSETRNKAIARVFKELDYIEQWGSGIKRIFSWCEEAGVAKPLITEKREVYLGKRQVNILYFCLVPRTSKEILDCLGVINHSKNRKSHVTGLVTLGLLARTIPENPNDRNPKYITTEAGKLYVEENDNRRKTR